MERIPLTTPNQPTLTTTDAIIHFAAVICYAIIVLACAGHDPYTAVNPRELDIRAEGRSWRVARAGWWQKFARRKPKSSPTHQDLEKGYGLFESKKMEE